ncbi:hypothetical protein CRUP_019210 [Coryphaenoides rupestris]|nr:hypothetical protein CRUP_019210 [Coryphaenoides rupestris]
MAECGVPCKAVMVFFHYCVMSNYFWLFIEGLYLFTLLVETFFPERRYFYWYTIVGWGGCWDTNEYTALWWVIKGPVVASIMINFILFVGIIIILVQKLQSPDIGGNESSIYLPVVLGDPCGEFIFSSVQEIFPASSGPVVEMMA